MILSTLQSDSNYLPTVGFVAKNIQLFRYIKSGERDAIDFASLDGSALGKLRISS